MITQSRTTLVSKLRADKNMLQLTYGSHDKGVDETIKFPWRYKLINIEGVTGQKDMLWVKK